MEYAIFYIICSINYGSPRNALAFRGGFVQWLNYRLTLFFHILTTNYLMIILIYNFKNYKETLFLFIEVSKIHRVFICR